MSASVRKMKAQDEMAQWAWAMEPPKRVYPMDCKLSNIHSRIRELQLKMGKTSSLIRKRNLGRKLHNLHAQLNHWEAQKLAWMLALP